MIILMVLWEIGVNMHPPLGDNKNYITLTYSGGGFYFNPPTPLFFYDFFLVIKYIPYLCLKYKNMNIGKDQKILELPCIEYFGSWEVLQRFLDKRGNPLFSIEGDLDLKRTSIQSLGNLVSVGGSLDLSFSDIESLGNLQSVGGDLDLYGTKIESLGNLESVGGYLDLGGTKIESLWNLKEVGGNLNLYDTPIEYLGNLESVGGEFDLRDTPISKMYSEDDIRKMVDVGGRIFM
jgi:hypothetical protein